MYLTPIIGGREVSSWILLVCAHDTINIPTVSVEHFTPVSVKN
jgi:hypothetical protein